MEQIFVQHLSHDFKESSLPQHYKPMREYVDEQTLLNEDPERIAHYFDASRALAQELGMTLRLPRTRPRMYPPGTPGRKRCDWPWSGGYISYEGVAMPCCMLSTPDRGAMGNMAEQGVAVVWNGEPFEDFRSRLASQNPPEVCQSCSLYHGTF